MAAHETEYSNLVNDELNWGTPLEKVNHYASEGVITIKTIRKIILNKY